jgi:hypothetical protein
MTHVLEQVDRLREKNAVSTYSSSGAIKPICVTFDTLIGHERELREGTV